MIIGMISKLCDYGGPYFAPFIAPIINPIAWVTLIILAVAIYTGENSYLSKKQGVKSYTTSMLNAFRINYLFHMVIVFFALKGTCGLKKNIESNAMNYIT